VQTARSSTRDFCPFLNHLERNVSAALDILITNNYATHNNGALKSGWRSTRATHIH
jgi:hypothetical protein